MATVSIRIPQLGEGLREAYLVDFLKSPGDAVLRDEPLYTMETDKAISDVESPHAGTLVKWLVDVDSVLEIGTEIALIETVSSNKNTQIVMPTQPAPAVNRDAGVTATSSVQSPTDSNAGFEMAIESPATPVAKTTTTSLIPPKTKRYLKEHHLMDVVDQIDVRGRKMTIDDVDRFLQSDTGAALAESAPATDEHFEVVPLPKSQIRLNYRLTQAAATCVPVTLVNEWNWGNIESARNVTRADGGPTAFAMACWCIAQAAQKHSSFRSSLTSDGKSYRVFKSVNLGIAVSLEEDQLVTAVVRNADSLSIEEFYNAYSESVALARTGVDQADESTTLMISNIGNIGMTIGIPAIVAPAVATLAIGQVVDKPIRDGDSFTFERSVTATMAFDHRIANGIGAASFLNDVRATVEGFQL